MTHSKLIDLIIREKNILIFLTFIMYGIIPILEGNLVLGYLANLYKENVPEFNSDTIIKVIEGMTYLFLYATLLFDIFIRVVVFSAITLFALYMLEESTNKSYKAIFLSFLSIELTILLIKLLYLIFHYVFILYNQESLEYIGMKFPIFSFLDQNINKSIIELLNVFSIELVLYLMLIGFLLKFMWGVKTYNVLAIFLFILLIYVFFEIISTIKSLFFTSQKLSA